MGLGCSSYSPVKHGGSCVKMLAGNAEGLWTGICRAMCRSRVCGHGSRKRRTMHTLVGWCGMSA